LLLGVGLAILTVLARRRRLVRRDEDGGAGPSNAIADAAAKTQNEGEGRAAVRGVMTESGLSKPLILTGQMVYNDAEPGTTWSPASGVSRTPTAPLNSSTRRPAPTR